MMAPIYCAKLAGPCTDGCKPEPGRLGDPCWRVDWRDLGNVAATYQVSAAIEQAAVLEVVGLAQAVLALNAAWNKKESEEAIAGHMDLCRRLAVSAASLVPIALPAEPVCYIHRDKLKHMQQEWIALCAAPANQQGGVKDAVQAERQRCADVCLARANTPYPQTKNGMGYSFSCEWNAARAADKGCAAAILASKGRAA